MTVRLVIFDMDGTLTKPFFDWPAMKRCMGLPLDRPILESLEALTPADRERCERQLQVFEDEAADRSELNHGAREALAYLDARGILKAILTRNSARSVERVLARHDLAFDTSITRHCAPPKPDPTAVHMIAERLGAPGRPVPPDEIIMVGDYEFDILSGRRAGAHTILLTNGEPNDFATKADADITTLADLPAAIERIEEVDCEQ